MAIESGAADTSPGGATPTPSPAKRQVLLVHEDVATMRLVRETLMNFTICEIDSSPNGEYAFEKALQRPYDLFIFSLTTPDLHGELLYGLISKAYRFIHKEARTAPAIIYLGTPADSLKVEQLQRDARVKGVLLKPIRIDRLIEKARLVLPPKNPL